MVRDRLHEMKIMISSENENSIRKPTNLQRSIEKAYDDIEAIESLLDELVAVHNGTFTLISSTKTNQIDAIVESIHETATEVKNVIKKLKGSVRMDDKSARGRMKYSQYTALSEKFANVIYRFNEEQLRYRSKCKDNIRLQMEVSAQMVSDEALEDMLEKGNVFIANSSEMAIEEAKLVLDEVKARHRDILHLEQSIRQMKKLFEDIAIIVENQGETISRIEDYVSATVDFVGKAQQDLQQAESHRTSARKKKLSILVIVFIVIIVSIGALFFGNAK